MRGRYARGPHAASVAAQLATWVLLAALTIVATVTAQWAAFLWMW